VCFGLEELREKIVARDAGLADLALEHLKADVLAANPELAQLGIQTLRLQAVGEDRRSACSWSKPVTRRASCSTAPSPSSAMSTRASPPMPTAELLARLPGIASGPHVSLLRLATGASRQ